MVVAVAWYCTLPTQDIAIAADLVTAMPALFCDNSKLLAHHMRSRRSLGIYPQLQA